VQPVTFLQHEASVLVLLASFAACDGGSDGGPPGLETTLADCGSSLDELLGQYIDAQPGLDQSYTDALASWSFSDNFCGLGVFAGQCADGKRLLYRNGGFTSEIRYFDGEQLVGFVGSGDVAVCPSICPLSRFYGDIGDVRCESPSLEELCPGSSRYIDDEGLWMPFANGQAPGGCD
jgi:hypothetical protein